MRQPEPGWLNPVGLQLDFPGQMGTESSASGHVASDTCDALVQYLDPRGVPGVCRWFALIRNSTAPRVPRTLTTVVVSVTIAEHVK